MKETRDGYQTENSEEFEAVRSDSYTRVMIDLLGFPIRVITKGNIAAVENVDPGDPDNKRVSPDVVRDTDILIKEFGRFKPRDDKSHGFHIH